MENIINITDRLPKADIKANIDKLLDILEMNLIELQTKQSDGKE